MQHLVLALACLTRASALSTSSFPSIARFRFAAYSVGKKSRHDSNPWCLRQQRLERKDLPALYAINIWPSLGSGGGGGDPEQREVMDAQVLARRRLIRTTSVLLVPSVGAGILAYFTFGPLCQLLRQWVGLEALDVLSNDQGQFLQNFLGVIGILFSLLIGNTYSFCYNQQVMIYMAFFEEVSVAKALLEQISLVCRGRPYYELVLRNVEQYVKNDLRRVDLPPAVVLSSKPKDDPLEQIMWMTSVGTPSVVYDTVKWLRQARGQRLGAVQRKLPPLHFGLLFALAAIELSAFPLLSAGAAETVGSAILTVESAIFALMVSAVVLTLGVVLQLWRPSGSAYSVDSALAVMLQGLDSELQDRKSGLPPRASTGLPNPPAFPY